MVLAVGGYFISQQLEGLLGYSWGPGAPEDVAFVIDPSVDTGNASERRGCP